MFKKNDASILLFTLVMLSVLAILSQQLFRGAIIGSSFNSSMIDAKQARSLAIGGVNLAISQLTMEQSGEEKETKTKKDKAINNQLNQFILRVLPNINRWQTFDLKNEIDGIDGQVKICITCEDGKININNAFDFKKGEFKAQFKKRFGALEIPGKLKVGEILKDLTKFFKERNRKLDDISELVNVPGLEDVDVFYQPPEISKTKKLSTSNSSIYLQDLFTIWGGGNKDLIDLLFMSDSVLGIFQLRRPVADDSDKLKDKFKKLAENFSKDWPKKWEDNWNFLDPIFGKKPKDFNEIKKYFSKEFGPTVYSVLSYGKVGKVEQRLLAVVKKVKEDKKEEKVDASKNKKSSESEKVEGSQNFKIIRMYWL